MRRALLLGIVLVSCTPSSVNDAEKKHDVAWLVKNGSSDAIRALGKLADTDKPAEDALEKLSTQGSSASLDGGASALDVYIAAWAGVERKAPWATAMIKRALGDRARMEDAATVIKHDGPGVAAFTSELDVALKNGCHVVCGSALASAPGPDVPHLIELRLADAGTREAMCNGLGTDASTKEARAVFMRVPDSSRDAPTCPAAAARMATHDDDVLAWLAKTAESGLLRGVGTSDWLACDRVAKLWTMALGSREHAVFGALAVPLGAAIKRCAKALDPMLSGALVSDAASQTLAVTAIDPHDPSVMDLAASCAALPNVARSTTSPPMKARAQEALARCKH